jgi:hypothetical protein
MASQDPFPLMPPKSTELRMMHFDEYVYTGTSSTVLYKYMDALCGTTGAGALVNEIFLARMGGALETIYFNELDFIFGKVNFLARSSAESYTYNPLVDQLTSDQWDEVRVKDAWYRARIKEFFQACTLGGTPDGFRMACQAALAVDCDLYEVWRYADNFGLTADLGRAPHTARNEVVVKPHKSELSGAELKLLRDMLTKIAPLDAIVTIDLNGLAVNSPLPVSAASADSTYYEVQKMVTATPALDSLPAPELLPIDLLPTEQWLYQAKHDATLAPYTAFNITQEFGYFYLVGGGKRSPIDSVTYGTLQADGTVKPETNYSHFETTGQYTEKVPFDKADSPDNFPGGKWGLHPDRTPALNADGSPYHFPFLDQIAFIAHEVARILTLGGLTFDDGYKLPVTKPSSSAYVFYPEYAISYFPPSKDSDVTTSITRRRGSNMVLSPEPRDPINYVRSS